MPTDPATVAHLCSQLAGAGDVSSRKMFGEYGLYCDGVFVGVVCDDTLFIKPTPAGDRLTPDMDRAPPYDGAKPSIRVPAERIDDAPWLAELVRQTAAALAKRK
jgi:DNA transformation protein and related proteins